MKKTKRLKLKPSARDTRRYFIAASSHKKVEEAILTYLGILGFAKSAYLRVRIPGSKKKTVGSCRVKSLDDIRAALTLEGIKIEKVSGTIKGLGK